MTIKGKAYIGGIFEHPARKLGNDISQAELHAQCCKGALADAGLDALEAFHPDHDAAAVARYTRLAEQRGLLLTGGSDFHGDPAHGCTPGSVTLPAVHWQRLLHRRPASA